jgi:hypothetical protein
MTETAGASDSAGFVWCVEWESKLTGDSLSLSCGWCSVFVQLHCGLFTRADTAFVCLRSPQMMLRVSNTEAAQQRPKEFHNFTVSMIGWLWQLEWINENVQQPLRHVGIMFLYQCLLYILRQESCSSWHRDIQGGSDMTGTNCDLFTQSVAVIFEPPCI